MLHVITAHHRLYHHLIFFTTMTNFANLAMAASKYTNKGGKAPRQTKAPKLAATRGQSVATAVYVERISNSETRDEDMEDEHTEELQCSEP